MDRSDREPPHIDTSLDPIRAAISIVADGSARRVIVHTRAAKQVMPAARQLARAAGVTVELVGSTDDGLDVVVLPDLRRGA